MMNGIYEVGDTLKFRWPQSQMYQTFSLRRSDGTAFLVSREGYATVLAARDGYYSLEIHPGLKVIRSGAPRDVGNEILTMNHRWVTAHMYFSATR
jgi:hypothetical protein